MYTHGAGGIDDDDEDAFQKMKMIIDDDAKPQPKLKKY